MLKRIFLAFLLSSFIYGCSDKKADKDSLPKNKIIERTIDPIHFSQGQKLFKLNCASCHGKQAVGAMDRRKPDSPRNNPPLPLNRT